MKVGVVLDFNIRTKDFRFFNFIHRKETAFQIMIYMHSKQ